MSVGAYILLSFASILPHLLWNWKNGVSYFLTSCRTIYARLVDDYSIPSVTITMGQLVLPYCT
jgi:hypothetical protein